MMRWILWIAAGLTVLALIVAAVGASLPKAHVALRTARIAMPPEALYALLVDVDRYPSWRPDVKSLQRLPDREGRPAWIEDVGGMKIPLHFERLERPAVLVSRIDGANLPFGGAWTYQIAPAPGGSDLTITENGEVSNVIFRFMSRFVFGHHATMDGFIKNLKAKAGK
jgi:ribosome-associated toxin RatA of RatAB toxin-antitoxin module